jgi:hypothetical protein
MAEMLGEEGVFDQNSPVKTEREEGESAADTPIETQIEQEEAELEKFSALRKEAQRKWEAAERPKEKRQRCGKKLKRSVGVCEKSGNRARRAGAGACGASGGALQDGGRVAEGSRGRPV